MQRIKLIYFVFMWISTSVMGQSEGCTDQNALNYNQDAIVNDGSCIYPLTTYIPNQVNDLPLSVKETSGLIKLKNGFWTHNDSGNTSELFLLDTINYEVIRTVYINSHDNIDWEELTYNENYIFIGDFGNNNGNRIDLRVLRFDKSLLLEENIDTIQAEEIKFSYPDQINFESSNDHNFDCEAFVFFNDSLQLFTKHWGNEYTKHYTLPANPGNYVAILKDSLFVQGQVTASHIQGDTLIALLGYRPNSFFEPFMFLLWDYEGDDFFGGNKRRIKLGTVLDMGQNEAIHFTGDYIGYITSEEIPQMNKNAAIYFFGIAHLFEIDLQIINEKNNSNLAIKVFPNPSKENLTIESAKLLVKEVFLINPSGKIVYHRAIEKQGKYEVMLEIQKIKSGNYFLQIKFVNGDMMVKKIIKE